MPGILQNLATTAAKVAGIDLSFENGVANVTLTDAQIAQAQNLIRGLLKSTDVTSGKSKFNVKGAWKIIGIPVMETYGFWIIGGVTFLFVGGILVGTYVGRKH